MEIKVLNEDKNSIEFELGGENHTFCNLLRKELWESKDVSLASYNYKHPLISSPVFTLRVKSGKPKKLLSDAVDSLKKKTKDLRTQLKKLE